MFIECCMMIAREYLLTNNKMLMIYLAQIIFMLNKNNVMFITCCIMIAREYLLTNNKMLMIYLAQIILILNKIFLCLLSLYNDYAGIFINE